MAWPRRRVNGRARRKAEGVEGRKEQGGEVMVDSLLASSVRGEAKEAVGGAKRPKRPGDRSTGGEAGGWLQPRES